MPSDSEQTCPPPAGASSGGDQLDPGQPEPGRLELGGRRQELLTLKQSGEGLGPRPFPYPGAEGDGPVVGPAARVQPQEPLDEPVGLAPLDPVPAHRLPNDSEGGQQGGRHPLDDLVGIALEDGRGGLELLQHLELLGRLHCAEHGVRVAHEALKGGRVVEVERPELGLEGGGVDPERAHVLAGELDEPLPDPGSPAEPGPDRLLEGDIEAEVVGGDRPGGVEGLEVRHHEGRPGRVGHGEEQVVLAEEPPGELADHEAALHPEQQGAEGTQEAGERVSGVGEVRPLALEGHGQALEHRPHGDESPLGPLPSTERIDGRRHRGESGLGQDVGFGGARHLPQTGPLGRPDGRFLASLQRHPPGHLTGDFPVDRTLDLEKPQHLAEVKAPEWTKGLRGVAHSDQSMAMRTVAVTGVSGFLGQGLVRRLVREGTARRLVGLDVREPAFRPRELEHHLVDVTGSELAPLLEGVDVLVHLAGVHDTIPDEDLMARVNITGTRRILEAAGAAGVGKVVLASSAAVYGAWPNNPIPLNEDAPLRPNPGFPLGVHKAEGERLLAEWASAHPDAVATVLRPAFVLGPRADHAVARLVRSRLPMGIAGAAAPVQFAHEDDAVEALALAVERDLPGAYNVAADGWIAREELRALLGRRLQLAVSAEVMGRALGRLWPAGLVDLPPSAIPYLVYPWVVAIDRLRAQGWAPRYTNEEAVLSCMGRRARPARLPLAAAAVAGVAGVGLAAARVARRSLAGRG